MQSRIREGRSQRRHARDSWVMNTANALMSVLNEMIDEEETRHPVATTTVVTRLDDVDTQRCMKELQPYFDVRVRCAGNLAAIKLTQK